MLVREFLNNVAKVLTEEKGVPYSLRCFKYPVQYVGMGTHSDNPVEYYDPVLENVIAVTRDDYDVENMFQGFFCYPAEYPEFYETGEFILCYGPRRDLNFDEILDREIVLEDGMYYGLTDEVMAKASEGHTFHR